MSKISKYNQAIFACSAIVVASLGSFVQSATAGGTNTDGGGFIPPVTINSNPGNPVPTPPVKPPVTANSNPGNPVTANSDPGNPPPKDKGPKPVTANSNPGNPVTANSDPGNPPPKDKGPKPVTANSDPGNPVTANSDPGNTPPKKDKPGKFIGSEGSGANNATTTGSNAANSDGGGGRFSSSTISMSNDIKGRFASAMSKYEIAAANLAAAETGQNNASSSTSPVRYGREPGDIAACGCPNADVPTAGTPSKELVAAKAAEAEAAAELAAAKAEARKFLESVNSNSGSGSTTFQPVW
jgi:hypothetical protein